MSVIDYGVHVILLQYLCSIINDLLIDFCSKINKVENLF